MSGAGWSLAQAVNWIIEHKCGVSLPVDQDTSVALLSDLEGDTRLPPNVATESEAELVRHLAGGRISASAIRAFSGEFVEIPAHEWLLLSISPALEGDRLIGVGKGDFWGITYRDIRVLPENVREVWPSHRLARRPHQHLVYSAESKVDHSILQIQPGMVVNRPRRGARQKFDWVSFNKELARLIEYEGRPDPSADPGWNQARVEERMSAWCSDNWGSEPSKSSVREHVSRYLGSLEG